jgi:hypothetical protein
MQGHSTALASQRSTTFLTAASLADADAFKTLIATDPAAAHTYSAADLNGALANPGPVTDLKMLVPRFPTVTTTADAATYNTTDPIVFTGTRGGLAATVSITLTQAGGGETLIGATPLDTLTSIHVPIQLQNIGEFTFGFSGVAARKRNGMTQRMPFEAFADGIVKVGYEDGTTNSLTLVAHDVSPASPYRIYADTTAVGVIVYD